MASEAHEPGSESGKRSDAPQEGGASSHSAARPSPRSPGSGAGPQDRAEPLRRVRPTPERRQARAVREEVERWDWVPSRSRASEAVS